MLTAVAPVPGGIRTGPGLPGGVSAARRERADQALLTGPDAEHVLRAVLDAEGVRLSTWAVHQVHHRPGVGVTVGWTVRWEQGEGDAVRGGEEYLLGTTAPVPAGTARSTTVRIADRDVTVWRHPADPVLPGLATASDHALVAAALGLEPTQMLLELVTYRPLRRAVLRASTGTTTAYLKVVRPHTAGDLTRRHALLLAAGLPVAPAQDLGDGVLRLGMVPGRPLTDALAADGAAGVDPHDVLALLDRFPAALRDLPRRAAWSERLRHHTDAAATAVPGHAREIETVSRRVAELLRTSDAGPVVATHGDLHDANLLLSGDRITGVLDVDGAGPGHRVDDLACLLGHLSVLPALAPHVHRHVPAALPRWTAAFERDVDAVALRARAAAVVLSLVAGARRESRDGWQAEAEGRIAAAAQWVDEAESSR
ncbi:aminoglycoside phosphotransferase family protein [Actinotalea sp. Marseille-Q4924]|uniref:aminoglycoside phosphotransferase family protein n=1 Tax=Actinotalea sp. Marseille-Q4924 TaxID=2866571 RepID=UPI001CE440AC|nr:aminoglycoside phosphotransferase family protein [Actinotalea sp. Marseille-Q4924]